ncbi:hypothetical protein HKX48_008565 [Thoreauomyces humboldtii]|nr:hypothetical protein HKX48_008565 [Thoreauomyces humboldtii]
MSHPQSPYTPSLPIILGSSSKYRASILKANNLTFTTLSPDIAEKNVLNRDEANPSSVALTVARAKADALVSSLGSHAPACLLVTTDQVVAYNGGVREKPKSRDECRAYLRSYATQPAETHSAIVVTNMGTGKRVEGIDIARQHFIEIPDSVVDELIAKGDVMYCSGGFMIDDRKMELTVSFSSLTGFALIEVPLVHPALLHPYLTKREGDEDSIIGMPMQLLYRLLREVESS